MSKKDDTMRVDRINLSISHELLYTLIIGSALNDGLIPQSFPSDQFRVDGAICPECDDEGNEIEGSPFCVELERRTITTALKRAMGGES